MELNDFVRNRESALINELAAIQAGIDDKTGKGSFAEDFADANLIRPFLPPQFDCVKGVVVTTESPCRQSKCIDRIIYDRSVAPPLIYTPHHSVVPIECVCGVVEITLHLDASKLECDIRHMAEVKSMRKRRYYERVRGLATVARHAYLCK